MAKIENHLDIYYGDENANTFRQESDIGVIIKKRNPLGWKLMSTSSVHFDTTNQFSNPYLFG